MSNTIISTAITTGTRRWYRTMGGAPSDLALDMIAHDYDPSVINNLSAAGATDAQLQNLYDNYGAGTTEFAQAANQLKIQLTGGPGGAVGPGYPANAVPTAYGVLDLTAQSTWDVIAGRFADTQQTLAQLARQAPNDPDVVSLVSQFNDTVNKYAGYYNTVFGNNPSPMPLVTMAGLGIAPLVIGAAAVAAGMVALLGTLYLLNQRILAKAQQIQAQSGLVSAQAQQAASAAAQAQASNLNAQANALRSQAASLPDGAQKNALLSQANNLQSQANQLLSQAALAVTPVPPGQSSTNWNVWLQQNAGLLIAALAAIVIVPPLLRRR